MYIMHQHIYISIVAKERKFKSCKKNYDKTNKKRDNNMDDDDKNIY